MRERGLLGILTTLSLAALVLPAGAAGAAVIIPVMNPSFESPDVVDGFVETDSADIPGWTVESGVGGVLDPTVGNGAGDMFSPGVIPNGDDQQVAFASAGTLTQLTGSTFTLVGGRYVLAVDVGNRKDADFSGEGGKIALFANSSSNLVAQNTYGNDFVANDSFETLTLTVNAADLGAFVGDTIGILLFGSNGAGVRQSAFDNVSLALVPLPGALPLLLSALAALGYFSWRQRKNA